MALMIFNIAVLEFGYWFDNGKIIYIILVSGRIQGKVLLIITAILFGIGHIIITYNNNR